jgi:alpha-beta hydrolase superfamily lysophospholipase
VVLASAQYRWDSYAKSAQVSSFDNQFAGGTMIKRLFHTGRRLLEMLLPGLLGVVVLAVVLVEFELNSRPDLSVWHTTVLDQEFSADSDIKTFAQYLELGERLFQQLDQEIYRKIESEEQRAYNRYHRGSFADPGRWPTNWNRSFVLPADKPDFGVLLLHGMSDSPYSLRSIGQLLHGRGGYVIGLRVPGHGQAPSGLLKVEWEDMAAAVRLAMNELQEKSGNRPMYLVGYSNGGALAVQYALDSVADSSLAAVDGLILMSAEIGISKLAVLAQWQLRLGSLLGHEKFAWSSLLPEYDPWKYGSFAMNAAKQAYRITQQIQQQISAQTEAGTLHRMPPILAFQSVVDATVTAPALVHNLFERLPAIPPQGGGAQKNIHQLVLYDINRYADIEPLMVENPSAWIEPMREQLNHKFMLTLVTNKDETDESMIATSRLPGSSAVEVCDTGLAWPKEVYSLSHVALPFAPDDPVYGGDAAGPSPGVRLGNLAMRGERKVLRVSATDMLRLRYNPFYSYQEQRMLAFIGLEVDVHEPCFMR